jgi:hypothetical protein
VKEHAARAIAALPRALRLLDAVGQPYPVSISERLAADRKALAARLAAHAQAPS